MSDNQGDTDQGDTAPENQGDTALATPDAIVKRMMEHWTGSEDALEMALEDFYSDIKDSLEKSLRRNWPLSGARGERQIEGVLNELTDYVAHEYF